MTTLTAMGTSTDTNTTMTTASTLTTMLDTCTMSTATTKVYFFFFFYSLYPSFSFFFNIVDIFVFSCTEHDDHHKHGHEHDHSHASPAPKKKKKTHNLSLVSSVGFTVVGLLDVALFNAFMSALLQAKAADLYRTKGVLAFANQGDTKFVFQGVHEQINFGPSDKPFAEGEVRESKMVFIGKNIDYEYLKESLINCCEEPAKAKITMHKR